MRTIYLVRHGHIDIGPGHKSICLGRKDVPLINEGVKQAERLAKASPKTLAKIAEIKARF